MSKREPNGYKERRGRQTLSDRETDYPDFTEEFGHLKRDAILGVHHKNAVMSLVEHRYKVIITLKPEGRTACYIEPVINDWFYRMLRHLFKSIILDCGMAFSNWKTMSNQKGVSIQFTDPGTPSQRELNEHINGMLRKDD